MEERLVWGYVEYFGTWCAVAQLGKCYMGPPTTWTYCVDPVTGEDLTEAVQVDLTAGEGPDQRNVGSAGALAGHTQTNSSPIRSPWSTSARVLTVSRVASRSLGLRIRWRNRLAQRSSGR